MACRATVRFFAVGHQPLKQTEVATVVRAMVKIYPRSSVVWIAAEIGMVLTESVKWLRMTALTPIFTDLSQVEFTASMFPVTGDATEFALFGFGRDGPNSARANHAGRSSEEPESSARLVCIASRTGSTLWG